MEVLVNVYQTTRRYIQEDNILPNVIISKAQTKKACRPVLTRNEQERIRVSRTHYGMHL
jgi:hypothetical protein